MKTITITAQKNLLSLITDAVCDKLSQPPANIVLSRRINSVKVVRIKRQLANGTYELDEKLDCVLEDLLRDLEM